MSVNDTNVNALREAVAARRAIVVLGAGATAATTKTPTASSWVKLLESGLDYVLQHRDGLPDGFEAMVRGQLAARDYTPALITAADLISHELGAPSGADFRAWLRETVGSASVDKPDLIDAVVALGVPIATVNYDTLVEQQTQRVSRTWRNPADLQSALNGMYSDVAHLHGCWTDPESVIFGGESYGRLLGNESAQALEKAIGSIHSLVFIGCGDTVSDPNFDGLLKWLETTYPNSALKHYRLCRTEELGILQADRTSVIPVAYGESHRELPDFVRNLASSVVAPASDASGKARADILDSLRSESVFADQLSDINVRSIDQLVVPPVVLPVTHEQYAAAQRDEDGPKIDRIDVAADLASHDTIIMVADESAGLTTALQWLVAQAQELESRCAPLVVDFRGLRGGTPLDRAIRKAIRNSGSSISAREPLPSLALAIDNTAPSDHGQFPRMLAELPLPSARWTIVGCRPGSEAQLDGMLRTAGLTPVTRYLGRLNTGDIKNLAALVAPKQADQLADKAVRIIQQEHLARTPLTVCLLVSVLLAGEALLSTASETALLDAYVSLLLGRGSAYDDARFILDSHDNSSLLSELARTLVELNSGAVEESVAIGTFETYFEQVGWTESASEALSTLVRRHVLVRKNGKVAFSQASLLHLFAAKKAVSDAELKERLLSNPLFYSEIIKHYAALTRNDTGLVERADDMITRLLGTVGASTSRSSIFQVQATEVVSNPEELDALLTDLGGPMYELEEGDHASRAGSGTLDRLEHDPLDDIHDDEWVPFPLSPVEDMPPLVRLMRTLSLASNILRDSEEVRDLELKRQTLGHLLKLWGVMVDAFEAEPGFTDFLKSTAQRLAADLDVTGDDQDALVNFISELGPLLTASSGMTLTLSSRKLALTLAKVLEDEEMANDPGMLIMAALLSHEIHQRGWGQAFNTTRGRIPQVKAVNDVLLPFANHEFYYGTNDLQDADALAQFIADHVSLRAGREGTLAQKQAQSRLAQDIRRNKLRLTLKEGAAPKALEGGAPSSAES